MPPSSTRNGPATQMLCIALIATTEPPSSTPSRITEVALTSLTVTDAISAPAAVPSPTSSSSSVACGVEYASATPAQASTR